MYTWYFTPFFFFNDTATTEIYTLSLHDALPIYRGARGVVRADRDEHRGGAAPRLRRAARRHVHQVRDRKSTRLNSSHGYISYAVFCLKKKKISTHYPKVSWMEDSPQDNTLQLLV